MPYPARLADHLDAEADKVGYSLSLLLPGAIVALLGCMSLRIQSVIDIRLAVK
jgi:hypothetical protein